MFSGNTTDPMTLAAQIAKLRARFGIARVALEGIAASVRAGTLKGAARIGHRVGRDANRRKVEKHFEITIADGEFSWRRNQVRIAAVPRSAGRVRIPHSSRRSRRRRPAAVR